MTEKKKIAYMKISLAEVPSQHDFVVKINEIIEVVNKLIEKEG